MSKNQLSVLIPDRSFTTSIGALTLKPFKFKQFKTALEIVEKYLKIFVGDEEITTAKIVNSLLEKVEEDYAVLEDILLLLSLVSGAETESLEDLQYDEVFSLLTEMIDQNMDFFSRIGQKLNPEKAEPETPTIGESESAA